MSFAATILQFVYGGIDYDKPLWQLIAEQRMKTTNNGLHPGRFVNCIEITMHAYKALLLQSPVFPSTSPLPTLPPFIPGYLAAVHKRILSLDESKQAYFFEEKNCSFSTLKTILKKNNVPFYSHLIIMASLKKLPGGHALSGIVLPNGLYLYDAQGFLPEAWLDENQFDEFYSISHVYVHDSETSLKAIEVFIEQCKSESALPMSPLKEIQPNDEPLLPPVLLGQRLLEFVQLELFRLQAKATIAAGIEQPYLQEKIKEYGQISDDLLNTESNTNLLVSRIKTLVNTAKIVKCHRYSLNWFDPQSLDYFRTFFTPHSEIKVYTGTSSFIEINEYLQSYLMHEIIRLCLLNELDNKYIENKINNFIEELEYLVSGQLNGAHLDSTLERINTLSTQGRHWFGIWGSKSELHYKTYLEPIKNILIDAQENVIWQQPF
ncbi:hypothetical protein TUM19329_02890 [Legionella antarctica]|uniref:Uncharacterized protein n=1 Tax=Legionella antarctica TaxID=2708020 RepID=A0A6F8T0F5_9GAMM|nr:hypothetical protein [Legionella antarctica]BCA93928.1 hypothetical protein TUM19329_02890 [Legionella antarctica]